MHARSGVRPLAKAVVPLLVAVVIGAGSFVYRFNTLGGRLGGFDNDHFGQLVRSMAVLEGERPLRDFTDTTLESLWPMPTYLSSAVAQQVLGRSLRTEGLLTAGMLSIGAIALFWLAYQFSRSIPLAALLTLLAIALRPALYNYPKIVPYVLALAAMLLYARRPTTTRLAALACSVAIAALFRHDHGVYLSMAAGTLVFLITVGVDERRRRLLAVAAICVAMLLPGVMFAQMHGGFFAYLRASFETSRQEAARTTRPGARFSIDWSQPFLTRSEPVQSRPRLAVRWNPALTAEMRARAEAELQLAEPVRRHDEWNWSYAVLTPSRDHLAAIVRDARVVDTDGINRATFAITAPPARRAPRLFQELRRWRIAPGLLTRANAVPWLYLVAWIVVLSAIVCVVWQSSTRTSTAATVPRPVVQATCVLALLMLLGLLRTANPSRLADVSVPVTVLGAWLLGVASHAVRRLPRPARYFARGVLIVVLSLTTLSVLLVGDVGHQLQIAGVSSAQDVRRQWRTVWSELGAMPSTLVAIDEDLRRTSSYLRRCTAPTDRVLVADNMPEIYYFAQRGFAAGQVSYSSNFYTSPAFQQTALARWARQSVPIALTQSASRFENEFSKDYPLLADYLRAHYRKVGSVPVEAGIEMDLWIDRRHAFSVDPETGLPCTDARVASLE